MGHIFCLSTPVSSKGWNLRYSPGQGNLHCFIVVLNVGEGSEREQCYLLSSPLAFSHFLHCLKANWALLVLIPGRCVCVHSRTLWVSPTNSPVRLGVSAATTPTGFFRGFEALFPHTGTLACVVCLTPQLFLPVYPHANVGLSKI